MFDVYDSAVLQYNLSVDFLVRLHSKEIAILQYLMISLVHFPLKSNSPWVVETMLNRQECSQGHSGWFEGGWCFCDSAVSLVDFLVRLVRLVFSRGSKEIQPGFSRHTYDILWSPNANPINRWSKNTGHTSRVGSEIRLLSCSCCFYHTEAWNFHQKTPPQVSRCVPCLG